MGTAQSKNSSTKRRLHARSTLTPQVHPAASVSTASLLKVDNNEAFARQKRLSALYSTDTSSRLVQSHLAQQTMSDLLPRSLPDSFQGTRLSFASTISSTSLSSALFSSRSSAPTSLSSATSACVKPFLASAAHTTTADRSRTPQENQSPSAAATSEPVDEHQLKIYADLVRNANVTGSTVAHVWVAQCKINGFGTTKDIDQGFQGLLDLAEHNHIEAYYPLAECYYFGNVPSRRPDKAAAFQWFERVTFSHDTSTLPPHTVALAQYRVASMLSKGEGVKPDPLKALDYFHRSADKENVYAQYMLGLHYHHGFAVSHADLQQACKWYECAAKQAYSEAQAMLGILLIDHMDLFSSRDKVLRDAIQWLNSAAEQNNPRALVRLGALYEEGQLVTHDPSYAITCYERAAAVATDPKSPVYALAHYFVGINYRLGDLGLRQDCTLARKHLTLAAQGGYAPAQRALGIMYLEGVGTEQDEALAYSLFTKAALQGDIRSLGLLGHQKEKGKGCAPDIKAALSLYGKSAEAGSVTAQLSLAELLQRTGRHAQAYSWFQRVVASDPPNTTTSTSILNFDITHTRQRNSARLMVARYRLNGWGGVVRDPEAAFADLLALSNEHFADAHYWVGACYEEGVIHHKKVIVERDPLRAFEFYEKAASQGDLDGQFQTAYMLANGITVKDPSNPNLSLSLLAKDHKRAFEWYAKAAERGHCTAQYSLGLYYAKGLDPAQRNPQVAKELFESAALQDSPLAMVSLAQLLLAQDSKDGSDVNPEAVQWLRKAASKGNTTALRELAGLYERGSLGKEEDDSTRHQNALQLLRKAAEQDDPKAWFDMAHFHEFGCAGNTDIQEALKCLEKSESLGHAPSGLALAELYERHDMWPKAMEKYESMAAAHSLLTSPGWKARLAQSKLVIMKNKGKQSDIVRVHARLHDMVQQSAGEALIEPFEMLGLYCEQGLGGTKDIDEAVTWYEAAINQSITGAFTHWIQERARFRLAVLYMQQKKHADALRCFRQLEPHLSIMNHQSPESRFHARQVRYYLGYLLLHGVDVETDQDEASAWLQQAADEGEGAAAYELGLLALAEEDDVEAHKRFDQGVSAGHPASTREFALLLDREHRYDRNWDGREAREWLERAAQLGDTESFVQLGLINERGQGTLKGGNLEAALRFYVTAAQQSNVQAMVKAGETYSALGRHCEAVAWYKKAIGNSVKAQVMLASYRLQGRGGLRQGDLQGFEELRAVAAQWHDKQGDTFSKEDLEGFGLAFFLLGQCHELGRGTSADVTEAKKWYLCAVSTQDHVEAMWRLGVTCSEEGDVVGALEWYQRAAEKSHRDAQYELGMHHWHGLVGLDHNPAAARKYLSKAADQGHPQAAYELGRILWGQQDYTQAIKYYQVAAKDLKVPEAMRELGHLHHEGFSSHRSKCVVSQDYKRAFTYYCEAARHGDAMAALMVGTYFEEGYLPEDLGIDRVQALGWYETAYNLQCGSLAELAIGKLKHMMADDLESDAADDLREEAYGWFESAAEHDQAPQPHTPSTPSTQSSLPPPQHSAYAKVMMALYHLNGWGRKVCNPQYGFQSLLLIAEAGGSEAFAEVAKCYEDGVGVERSASKALTYWELAADMDDMDALVRVGEYHEHGLAGSVNLAEAKRYYARSKIVGMSRGRERSNTLSSSSSSSIYSTSQISFSY